MRTYSPKWTASEEAKLKNMLSHRTTSMSKCFKSFASQSNRSKRAVEQHYYMLLKQNPSLAKPIETVTENKVNRSWTKAEDDRLLRQIKAFPTNLSFCFNTVAEAIGRTPTACMNRWYKVLSQKPDIALYFGVYETKVMKNRKQGNSGVTNIPSVWRRIQILLKSLF